jgi:hypothetical protein
LGKIPENIHLLEELLQFNLRKNQVLFCLVNNLVDWEDPREYLSTSKSDLLEPGKKPANWAIAE